MATVDVVPIRLGTMGRHLPALAERLGRVLDVVVRIREPAFDPEECFEPRRGQYHSTRLLARLLAGPWDGDRVLGVAGVDLFIPVLTFVFGEAQLDGRAAVVSATRLDPRFYGLPADERLQLDRLEKEAIHELGHTFGLVHCAAWGCVMRSSTYAEELELKTGSFCDECAADMRVHPVLQGVAGSRT